MDISKLERTLLQQVQANPEAEVGLIVRVAGDLELRAGELSRQGLTVSRRLRLVGALALRATGRQALALTDRPWVLRIEPDREVRAL
ncbi:MAG TPA: hypothetical protein PLJ35_18240 [Anaerolineae bacterium]|nr:hypothetical protein [Anaerolineae bacterium]HOR00758.1 hypothetical protein [Anaerolineae bacterium]HPL28011.1 hypothetical protein [Anaerolineae bacterium]